MSSSGGSCLVARAVPIPSSNTKCSSAAAMKQEQEEEVKTVKGKQSSVDALASTLTDLKIGGGKNATATSKKPSSPPKNGSSSKKPVVPMVSPAEYFSSQSMVSSLIARKPNTTTKVSRDNSNLMADLLSFNEELSVASKEEVKTDESVSKKSQEKTKEAVVSANNVQETKVVKESDAKKAEKQTDCAGKEEEKAEEGELLDRGPVRASRTPVNYHPYVGAASLGYGTAPQSTVADPSAYNTHNGYAYDCGVQSAGYYYGNNEGGREYLSNSSTPDTINSDLGYGSATSPPQMKYGMPTSMVMFEDGRMGHEVCSDDMKTSALGRLANSKLDSTELPDALSDFILKYSRRYTPSVDGGSTCSRKNSLSTIGDNSPKGLDHHDQSDSLCNSPLSAGSAPSGHSPAAPYGAVSDHQHISPPTSAKLPNGYLQQQFAGLTDPLLLAQQKQKTNKRPAKERLRALIGNEDMDEAWAWTCKFIQASCECLSYQDNGGDTLLHIVVCQPNMDLAKIYALVEQMIKMESEFANKPFDLPNRYNETPLFLAVEKRHNEVVDYLLEAGASPNTQNSRSEREAPLHYAAARGMVDIVKTLCSYSTTNLNMQNGMGLTPLLCAVKNHGVLEEESQSIIDNKATIQLLLKYGADPTITDATNGKSVIMYAVERMNAEIIEIFQSSLAEEAMATLVNKPDLCEETPMSALQTLINVDADVRSKLGLTLITCGASSN